MRKENKCNDGFECTANGYGSECLYYHAEVGGHCDCKGAFYRECMNQQARTAALASAIVEIRRCISDLTQLTGVRR